MKPWKTVLEDQATNAQQVQEILKKEVPKSKKSLAFLIACVGIILMAIGVSPFLTTNFGDHISSNIFSGDEADTETDTTVEDYLSEEMDTMTEEYAIDPIGTLVNEEDVDTTGVIDFSEETVDINVEPETIDVVGQPEEINIEPMVVETPPAFRVNTHTGTTDKNLVAVAINDGAENNSVNLHSAPMTSTVDSGPEMWVFAVLSVLAAVWMRRKKRALVN